MRKDRVLALLKKHKFEESLLIALPAALAKPADARGHFDLLAVTQIEAEVNKVIEEQTRLIAAVEPESKQCDQAVETAKNNLEEAKTAQIAAAKGFCGIADERDKLDG